MHVLVTGASSGIGEALALKVGGLGHSVTLAARRQERLEALAARIDAPTFVRPTDLSVLENCQALWSDAREALGPVDVLINNAGVQYVEPTVGISPERGERLMTVNVLAPMRLQGYALEEMLGRGEGVIVNIASIAGWVHTPGMCHYNASKAALAAASESLRVEIEGTGVHVVTVYPGPVASEMESAARDAYEGGAADKLPTGNTETLSGLVWDAVTNQRARVVYPKMYAATRHARVLSQWVTDKFTPSLK